MDLRRRHDIDALQIEMSVYIVVTTLPCHAPNLEEIHGGPTYVNDSVALSSRETVEDAPQEEEMGGKLYIAWEKRYRDTTWMSCCRVQIPYKSKPKLSAAGPDTRSLCEKVSDYSLCLSESANRLSSNVESESDEAGSVPRWGLTAEESYGTFSKHELREHLIQKRFEMGEIDNGGRRLIYMPDLVSLPIAQLGGTATFDENKHRPSSEWARLSELLFEYQPPSLLSFSAIPTTRLENRALPQPTAGFAAAGTAERDHWCKHMWDYQEGQLQSDGQASSTEAESQPEQGEVPFLPSPNPSEIADADGEKRSVWRAPTSRHEDESKSWKSPARDLAAAAVSIGTALIMGNYEPGTHTPHSSPHQRHNDQATYLALMLEYCIAPTPIYFVIATLTNGLATYAYYLSRNKDQYQLFFMGAGTAAAVGTSLFTRLDAQATLLKIMPLAFISSLILCTASNVSCRALTRLEKG